MLSFSRGNVASARDGSRGECSLARLQCADVNLVSWQRPIPYVMQTQIESWASDTKTTFDEVVELASDDYSLATTGMAEPLRSWMRMDLAVLLALFSHAAEATRLRVSFGVVRTDQCRKFHVDYVRFRLVTTYLGPGTEWVPNRAVSREALAHPPDCPCEANARIVHDPDAVQHAKTGEVLVMKGARHAHGIPLVHRSPPIAASGSLRVVLIASTVDAA